MNSTVKSSKKEQEFFFNKCYQQIADLEYRYIKINSFTHIKFTKARGLVDLAVKNNYSPDDYCCNLLKQKITHLGKLF